MSQNLNDINKMLNFAVKKYVEKPHETTLDNLLVTLATTYELDIYDIDVNTVYILYYIYQHNKAVFDWQLEKYLDSLFYRCFRNCLKLDTLSIENELKNISDKIEATSNIFNCIK